MNERERAHKADVAELLLAAAREFGETLEPERVYERFHALLRDVVPHDGLVVSSYDERDDLIRCEYAWVEGNVIDPATLPALALNREGGMQSRVIRSGEPMLYNDVADRVQDPQGVFYNVDREGTIEKLPDSGPSGTSAAMMLPVRHEDRSVGVVQVMRDRGAYTEAQLELVSGLVAQMAAAVRNARLQKERRRLEAAEAAARAAAAEREQAAQVLDAVGDGIFLLDAGGYVRLWNRAAALATGIAVTEVLGRRLADAAPGWAAIEERVPVAEGGEAPPSVTLPFAFGDRDLWLSFVAVRAAEGIVYAFRDLTAERRLEEEKSDFVATISHELRTPMAAVYGAAETLLERDVELTRDQRRDLLEMIRTQASRLSQIVEEVLLTSKLDRDEVPVEREPVDVADLVRSTVAAFSAQLQQDIDVQLSPQTTVAAGDADRIQQILVNLLDNAVKYGGAGVRVRTSSDGHVVRVVVSDDGPGVAPADRERIFEKFYRGDPQLVHSPGGTGLGLYISRELARRMGGRLDVDPAAEAGARFVFELPADEAVLAHRFR